MTISPYGIMTLLKDDPQIKRRSGSVKMQQRFVTHVKLMLSARFPPAKYARTFENDPPGQHPRRIRHNECKSFMFNARDTIYAKAGMSTTWQTNAILNAFL